MIVDPPFLAPGAADLPQVESPEAASLTQSVHGQAEGDVPLEIALFQRQLSVADAEPTLGMSERIQQLDDKYPDKDGDTVMHIAAVKSDLNLASLWRCNFQDKFAEQLNRQNLLGQTPLHLAVINNDPPMIDFLLQNGASIEIQEMDGRNSIHMACQYGDINTLGQLLKFAGQREINLPSVINTAEHCDGGLNCLLFFLRHHEPVPESQFAVIDLLFSYGANPDFADKCSGKNLVHYIADQNNVALYNYLRERYPQYIHWEAPRFDGTFITFDGETFVHTKPETPEED